MSDPVFVIVQMKVTEPEAFKADYAGPLVGQFMELGVKILGVTPAPRVIEGQYDRNNTVLLEFPSEAVFDDWYSSAAYAPLKAIRDRLSDPSETLMLVVPAFPALPGAPA